MPARRAAIGFEPRKSYSSQPSSPSALSASWTAATSTDITREYSPPVTGFDAEPACKVVTGGHMATPSDQTISRRDILQILAALGFTGAAADRLAAAAAPTVSSDTLRGAAS